MSIALTVQELYPNNYLDCILISNLWKNADFNKNLTGGYMGEITYRAYRSQLDINIF